MILIILHIKGKWFVCRHVGTCLGKIDMVVYFYCGQKVDNYIFKLRVLVSLTG